MKKFLLLFILLNSLLFSKEFLSEESEFIDIYFEKKEGGGYDFYGDNNHFIPQFISLGFTKLTNLKMDRDNPSLTTLQPGEKEVLLFSLTPREPNKSYSFRSKLIYSNGDPLSVAPDDYIYTFPFNHGSKFRLDQGYGGKFSHQDENFYALDFTMDIGTPVHAARDGVVIEVKVDSNRRGTTKAYAKYGNFISIYHDDGTFASYVHLRKNGSIVKVGDKVKVGDHIGYSGNTGLSTGPHLHFSVNIPSLSGVRESIPVMFFNYDGSVIDKPTLGDYYYSYHLGKEEFETSFGKNLTNESFTDYALSVPETGKLELRYDKIDSTNILYCKNGNTKEARVTFKIGGANSEISRKSPFNISIPPLTEVFICLLRPKDPAKSTKFNTSISYVFAD